MVSNRARSRAEEGRASSHRSIPCRVTWLMFPLVACDDGSSWLPKKLMNEFCGRHRIIRKCYNILEDCI